jgi:hypothetical protein
MGRRENILEETTGNLQKRHVRSGLIEEIGREEKEE